MSTPTPIPIPKGWSGSGRKLKYPWHELSDKGASIFILHVHPGAALQGAKSYWERRKQAAKFTSRCVIEDGRYGVRLWRIE